VIDKTDDIIHKYSISFRVFEVQGIIGIFAAFSLLMAGSASSQE
jgi:hypothetical protein